jgi:hypothetical protein
VCDLMSITCTGSNLSTSDMFMLIVLDELSRDACDSDVLHTNFV